MGVEPTVFGPLPKAESQFAEPDRLLRPAAGLIQQASTPNAGVVPTTVQGVMDDLKGLLMLMFNKVLALSLEGP